ncbi:MAG: ATP-binding protein [Elusimicrobia bacterium]|nr:ATP-binding protein [Elusimicrobiota bacterium]
MLIDRHILSWALSDESLRERMSFIAGPRQIGKTTAIQKFLSTKAAAGLYYNWDAYGVKKRFAANPLFFTDDLPAQTPRCWVALDEIHKYPKWKNILKGYYDEWKNKVQFIVTGSARLEFFKKSGDSLVGRYFSFRMLPLGIREVAGMPHQLNEDLILSGNQRLVIPEVKMEITQAVESLLGLTGYPEPFAAGRDRFCARWRENHISLIIREDLRDLTKVTQIQKIEVLLYLLPPRVGSPLSLNSLQAPLECAYGSVRTWLNYLEAVYLIFSLSPWTTRLSRSVLKEKKYYFWDWGMVEEQGQRFENFIAVALERAVSCWNENGLGPLKLYYIRTKDGLEVDFAVANKQRVLFLVETKLQDSSLSQNLVTFKEKTAARLAFQVIKQKNYCAQKANNIYVIGADRFLNLLP